MEKNINEILKGALKLDKRTYEILSEKDYEHAWFNLMDSLRNNLKDEDPITYGVAISTLAMVLKEVQDRTSMIDYLENHINDETTLTFLKKVEKENWDQVEEISNNFDIKTLKAAALFAEPKRFTESGESSTPEGISNLAISLLDLNENDTILDLGSGVSSFLIQAAQVSESEDLYGVEINTNNVIIANLRRFITGLPIKVIQGNIVSQEFTYLSANKVFSNYPLGMRLSSLNNYLSQNRILNKYFKDAKKTVSGDWVFGMGAHLNTQIPGKTVILMTNAGTWNKPDEGLRKKIVDSGIVEGVILLPERLLSSTMIPLTMLVLSQNNKEIRMVDASEIYTEGRRQNSLESIDVEKIVKAYHSDTSISKRVQIDEIAKQEYILNSQRYIGVDIGINDGVPLGELCLSINRGAMIRSSELDELISAEDTDYHYLMLQNIQEGVIDSNLPNLVSLEDKYTRHCIKDRNLIISKNSPFKVAMAHVQENETILANGNLYFIELDESKVNPVFVEVFLQSETGIAQLNRFSKGAVMKNISIQDLKMILIPNISREKQDSIAEEYENLCDELIVLQKQADIIRDKKAKLLEGVL